MPASDLFTATAMAHYARGVALASTGRAADAAAELDAIERMVAEEELPEEEQGPNAVISIARHALAGEIALRTGSPEEAIRHLEAAASIEDGMLYDEPPLWYRPIRHSLGRAFLEAGQPADAERTYGEDLERFPENGWALYGLAAALRAQGKEAEAEQVDARFRGAWSGADVELTSSVF